MRTFIATLKMETKRTFQYRAAAISGIFTHLFFGFMYIALFTTFLSQGQDGFTLEQMATYVWLQQAFLHILKYHDSCKQDITEKIMNGDIAYQLLRPADLYNYWYTLNFTKPIGHFLLRGIPIIIIGLCLPAGMGLGLPSPINFLLFLLSISIGVLLVVAINTFAHVIVMYTMSGKGVFSFLVAVGSFFCGHLIPIPMMPDIAQKILNFFPFRYVSDLPFRIYLGNITGAEMWFQIGIQVAWLAFFVIIGKIMLKFKLKKFVVQGG